jgi:nucleoside-diphosphate-sugar epimerase
MHGGTAVYAMSRVGGPPGHIMRATLQAAYGGGISTFVYLSSSGLYGAAPDDETWVDEETPVVHDQDMQYALDDEREIENCTFDRVKTVILRLAPVYGPGKGVRERLKKGDYRLLDEGQHAISRIHIEDVARIVFAAEDKAPNRAKYLVADDEPTTQRDYAAWLCERMGLPMPGTRSMYEPGGTRVVFRNRKIRNAKLKRELEIELKYPTFREGEAAIEAVAGT